MWYDFPMENKKNTATNNPEMVTISREEYEELKLQNQWLLEQLGLAKKRQFGKSSERLQEGLMDQLVLMANEAEAYSDNYTDTKTAEFTILAAPASGKVTITGADNKVDTELTASVTGNTHILFQFTPLREGRQGQCLPDAPGYCISIHAPARGATVLRGKRDGRGKISIHAPARGATAAPQLFCDFVVYFNSRPCERGDSPRRKWGVNLEYFNSRPCERGDQFDTASGVYVSISIHAPARGATAKLNKISVKFTEIIIKTEWEFKQYSSYGY